MAQDEGWINDSIVNIVSRIFCCIDAFGNLAVSKSLPSNAVKNVKFIKQKFPFSSQIPPSKSTFTDHLRLSHYLNIPTRHTPAAYFVPKALPRRLGKAFWAWETISIS